MGSMLSAIVVCRDRVAYLRRCLTSLLGQSAELGREYEIVVVEQGRAGEAVAGLPLTYVQLPYGAAVSRAWMCNVGARRAAGEWLYQIDCDMILERDAIRKAAAEAGSGRLGPRFYATTGLRDLGQRETEATQADHSLIPDWTWGEPHGHDGGAGNPVLFPADYYAWLGGYDEAFAGHGCQDLDMIERTRATGGLLATLPLAAWHQWHGPTPKRTAVASNWRRYRAMRRRMRSNPDLAVRNGGRWGNTDAPNGSVL